MTATSARPGFRVRIAALLIDYALILGWMAVLAGVALVLFAVTGGFFDWLVLGTVGAQLLGFLVLVLPVGLYLFLSEASARHATVGKRLLRLRVVSAADDSRPSRARVLVRTVLKLLPWEIAHFAVWNIVGLVAAEKVDFPPWLLVTVTVANVLPIVYVVMVAARKDQRGPHDLVAGTRVVRGP